MPLGSSQLVWCLLDVKDGAHILLPLALVLDHPVVDTGVLSLDVERRLGRQGVEHKVVVAVRAVLVAAPALVLAGVYVDDERFWLKRTCPRTRGRLCGRPFCTFCI